MKNYSNIVICTVIFGENSMQKLREFLRKEKREIVRMVIGMVNRI